MQNKFNYNFLPKYCGKFGRIGLLFLWAFLGLDGCNVGPNYVRPAAPVPEHYKEAAKGWKIASPQDAVDKGPWWLVFNNGELNFLEEQVNISNQNVAAAIAQYFQAQALVAQAESAFFPTLGATATVTREKQAVSSGSTVGGSTNNVYNLGLQASWEPDLWGSVRRQVEANQASAQASAAQVANIRLSMQATLAQNYYQMRALDAELAILNKIVSVDQDSLRITRERYHGGIAALTDVMQAETQLKTDQSAVMENRISRALLEHAIAVMIGRPPANLNIQPKVMALVPPPVPIEVPSAILERRPDVAQAERNIAAANAQVGVAIAAYFPTLTLSGTAGFQSFQLSRLFSQPTFYWSLGAQLAQTIIDGGFRESQVDIARANYAAAVAQYRQTVLAAFQEVEDNLVTLRVLNQEVVTRHQATTAAIKALQLVMINYKAGTLAYTDVIVAQNTAYNAARTETDVKGRRMVAAVGLIKALGGDWSACNLLDLGKSIRDPRV